MKKLYTNEPNLTPTLTPTPENDIPIEDINYYSFVVYPEDKKDNHNNTPQNTNLGKDNDTKEPEIRFSIQSFLDDRIELVQNEETDMMSCMNIMSMINEIHCPDDVKKEYSILEDDYLEKRILPKVSLQDFNKILKQYNKNYFIKLKSEIDRLNLYGPNISPVSNTSDLIKRSYLGDEEKKNKILSNIQMYDNMIFKWRSIKGDGNCFYRTVMFFYLEKLIHNKNTDELKNLIYDITQCFKDQFFVEAFQFYKVNKDKFLLILMLLYYALSLEDTKDSKTKAYTILVRVSNNYLDYDYGIVLYLKYSIMKYIKKNEGMLYSKEFSVKLDNLLPIQYQKDGKGFYQPFYERDLMPLGKDAEKIIIYIAPFVVGMGMKIYAFDFDKGEGMLNEFHFAVNDSTDLMTILYRNFHFEILYKKDYFLQNVEIFSLFSAIPNLTTNVSNIVKNSVNQNKNSKIETNNIQGANQSSILKNNNSNQSKIIKSQNNVQSNIQNNPQSVQEKKQMIRNLTSPNYFPSKSKENLHINHPSVKPELILNRLNSNSNIPQNKVLNTSPSNNCPPNNTTPNQIYKSQVINNQKQTEISYQCPKCHVKTQYNFYCDKCHSNYLKFWLKSSYCHFIQNNITNSITSKDIETFKQYLSKVFINYENGAKSLFNDAYNILKKESQFDVKEYILNLKNSLCLSCFNYLNINENTFYFQLPCKCIFCCLDCLRKFLAVAPFHMMGNYMCICGEEYDLITLKYMINFLSAHHFKKQQTQMFKFIYEKIKNKCAGCDKEITLSGDEKSNINILEVQDYEVEKVLNITKFNHLLCDHCWKEIKKDNKKFICPMCNSIHTITNKISKAGRKVSGSCVIF